MSKLNNKVAVITGGNSGIGLAIAEQARLDPRGLLTEPVADAPSMDALASYWVASQSGGAREANPRQVDDHGA